MGEEAREVDLAVVQENSSSLEDGDVNREAGLDLTSKNKSTEVPDEGDSKEQEELSEQIEVQGRIQVLH